jgi:hypothetical protein
LFQLSFQLEVIVKMILDGAFATPGDENNFCRARRHSLFHRVLNQGLVHNREHFLWAGLGRG